MNWKLAIRRVSLLSFFIIGTIFAPYQAASANESLIPSSEYEVTDVVLKSLSPGGAAIEFAVQFDDAVDERSTYGKPFAIAYLNLSDTVSDASELESDDFDVFNYGVVAFNDGKPTRVVTCSLSGEPTGSYYLEGMANYAKVSSSEVVLLGGRLDDRYVLSRDRTFIYPLNSAGAEMFKWSQAKDGTKVAEFRKEKLAYDAEVQRNYDALIAMEYGTDVPQVRPVGGITAPQPITAPESRISFSAKIVVGFVLLSGAIFGVKRFESTPLR